jgi:hypothetical protein
LSPGEPLERDDSDLRRPAANVDDHRSDRLGYGQAGADRRRHRLLNQRDPISAGVGDGIANRAPLDRGGAGGNADHHFWPAGEAARAAMGLADEMLDHLLGDLEVGDDPGTKRADGTKIVGSLAHHQLGIVADGANLPHAILDLHRHDRGLAGNDALSTDVDDRVGGAEIDCDVAGREVEE